ncbi:hypothetical protein IWW39_003521 [Coemansia spiralis]|uniref:AP-1 complex subunit sigma-1 n=1 Tax=Coemansia spiralis TaxID=417178 RepID=A0A9W8L3K0_9FUNG|nr:hypothetical protein IWW39_003521 [Coemansia spiralis]
MSSISSSPSLGSSTPVQPQPPTTSCVQTLTARSGAVLSVAYNQSYVFCGSQQGSIHVWRRDTYRLEATLEGHSGGCHSLAVDSNTLFSGGGDGRVRAWDMHTLRALYVIHAGVNSGAILSLVYLHSHRALVLGCQNTSLQWFSVAGRDAVPRDTRMRELQARRLRFFDDAIGVCTAQAAVTSPTPSDYEDVDQYLVSDSGIIDYAHSGYVYSLLADGDVVYSGGSDGVIKVWQASQGLALAGELERVASDVSVQALALDDGLLFAGLQSGQIDVWDLETRQRIRTLAAHGANVFALSVVRHCVFSASSDGDVRVWCSDLQTMGQIRTAGSVLALAAIDAAGEVLLVTGHGDSSVAFWDVTGMVAGGRDAAQALLGPAEGGRPGRRMMQALAQWVRFRSVSGVPELQPECRRAARFLRDLMQQLGATDARLVSSTPGSNPIVYGRFEGRQAQAAVFVYGHYDVMPAGDESRWASAPFEMSGRDGYVYGRGVSDDKGPVLATLFAVAELHAAGLLQMPVVFCIEGEEEHGSVGLYETIAEHRALFGEPRLILLSSSYWLGESTPCLTYGMRGSIRATIRVETSRNADVHSGVWGGAVNEPLTCLAHVLAQLAEPSGRVLVPGFHDGVRAVDAAEAAAMRDLVSFVSARDAAAPVLVSADGALDRQLMQRWRQPALTVHHVDVSTVAAPSNATLVPAAAQASVSVRVVPDQSLHDIAEKLRSHVEHVFEGFVGARGDALDALALKLDVTPIADWWLADPQTPVYRAASRAIREEWGMDDDPLLIREGGSIPAVPWLESFFTGAVAVNLPMGQSSDNAHLDNERISIENLLRGRQIAKLRLAKWYTTLTPKEKTKTIKEVSLVVLSRKPKQCNFIEHRDTKVVYRKYASLYFIAGIDLDDNELLTLEIIHRYVEVLDRSFGNVCELDLIFNFQRAYFILDEMIMAGELQESGKGTVLRVLAQMDETEAAENAERGWADINLEGVAKTAMLTVQEFKQSFTR